MEVLDEVLRVTGREPLPRSMRGFGTVFGSRSGSSSVATAPWPDAMAAVVVGGSAVWLLGVWLIVRRSSRLKADRASIVPMVAPVVDGAGGAA
jgi:hypothetical protein